jgi:hypothetical protein
VEEDDVGRGATRLLLGQADATHGCGLVPLVSAGVVREGASALVDPLGAQLLGWRSPLLRTRLDLLLVRLIEPLPSPLLVALVRLPLLAFLLPIALRLAGTRLSAWAKAHSLRIQAAALPPASLAPGCFVAHASDSSARALALCTEA